MLKPKNSLFTLLLVCSFTLNLCMADVDSSSVYKQLVSDLTIGTTPTVVLSATLNVTSATKPVLFVSDGRYYPNYSNPGLAQMWIRVNGSEFCPGTTTWTSSGALTDWRTGLTDTQAQRSFNVLGGCTLNPGAYTIELMGQEGTSTTFSVGGGTNLSVIVTPASTVRFSKLPSDIGPVNVTTAGRTPNCPTGDSIADAVVIDPNLTHVITTDASGTQPVISLASGRAYLNQNYQGDAMWAIFKGTPTIDPHRNDMQSWTVNDMCTCSETQAPLYAHAYFDGLAAFQDVSVKFGFTEFPTGTENPVQYFVGAGAQLISLSGGLRVRGKAVRSTCAWNWWDFTGADCYGPTRTYVWQSCFTIPSDHNGIVMFMLKTREQPQQTTFPGYSIGMGLEIGPASANCIASGSFSPVGSYGLQELRAGHLDSQRTLTASYLSAGPNGQSLAAGTYIVRGFIETFWADTGSPPCAFVFKDLSLIFFD